ncbi:MAG: type II toxin-antitoxin system RelE/ParE family toxin [Fibrobacter sp.]|jgi:phage-related protein|nr:type II toxin-antitoxin system RelE/ParE family toxin [Fibrobacter sp.]
MKIGIFIYQKPAFFLFLLLTLYQKGDTFGMKEYVAYEGPCFTIEWFYNEQGESQALEYFNELSDVQKRKVLMLFKRIGDFGRISDVTKFRNEGDKIFAFKPQPDRFLSFFYTGKKIIVTNAFRKKALKLPEEEKERAQLAMQNYNERILKDEYYEKD